jgi:hypothetical protein
LRDAWWQPSEASHQCYLPSNTTHGKCGVLSVAEHGEAAIGRLWNLANWILARM